MPTITLHDRQINYFCNNRKTPKLTVVLVHGAGGRSQGWPLQWQQTYAGGGRVRRWVSDYPVYIPDLPGHGQSDLPGYETIEAYAQFVIDFTIALNLEQVVIVGHSMGGAIAQQVAVMRPPNLRGLILLGSGTKMPVNDAILDGLQTQFEQTVQMITKFSWHKEATPAYVATGRAHMLGTDPAVVHGDFLACSRFDMREKASSIDVPVLVIGGEKDRMMPVTASEKIVALIPASQLAVIADAGHFMMYEKTAQTTKAMVSFLSTLE